MSGMTAYGTGVATGGCQWCGLHHGVQCPSVKAIEYFPDGTIKRVEFKGASDYPGVDVRPFPLPGPDGWKIA